MTKGIIFDIGETLIHNVGMDFKKSLSNLYDLSLCCKHEKNVFIEEGMKILNNIFNNRDNIEFKMKDYINSIIYLYDMKFNLNIDELEEVFALSSCKIELVDNVIEVLEYFKSKNYKMILLSNTSFSEKTVIKMLGYLAKYFDDIILSSEVIFRKPFPTIFEFGIKEMNMPLSNIYYIGNDYYCDVYGSYIAGINSIWFNEKKDKKNEKYYVKNFIEISSYIQLINMKF